MILATMSSAGGLCTPPAGSLAAIFRTADNEGNFSRRSGIDRILYDTRRFYPQGFVVDGFFDTWHIDAFLSDLVFL